MNSSEPDEYDWCKICTERKCVCQFDQPWRCDFCGELECVCDLNKSLNLVQSVKTSKFIPSFYVFNSAQKPKPSKYGTNTVRVFRMIIEST